MKVEVKELVIAVLGVFLLLLTCFDIGPSWKKNTRSSHIAAGVGFTSLTSSPVYSRGPDE